MGRSVLDDLGEEVTGIVAPVSLCMALTVALVRILNPSGSSNSNSVFIASAYYNEQAREGGTWSGTAAALPAAADAGGVQQAQRRAAAREAAGAWRLATGRRGRCASRC